MLDLCDITKDVLAALRAISNGVDSGKESPEHLSTFNRNTCTHASNYLHFASHERTILSATLQRHICKDSLTRISITLLLQIRSLLLSSFSLPTFPHSNSSSFRNLDSSLPQGLSSETLHVWRLSFTFRGKMMSNGTELAPPSWLGSQTSHSNAPALLDRKLPRRLTTATMLAVERYGPLSNESRILEIGVRVRRVRFVQRSFNCKFVIFGWVALHLM